MSIESAKEDFFSGLDSINVTCENFEDPDSARNFFQSVLKQRFINLKEKGLKEFIKFQELGAKRSEQEMGIKNYEQDVQNRKSVRELINSQIDAVNIAYGCSIIHLYE